VEFDAMVDPLADLHHPDVSTVIAEKSIHPPCAVFRNENVNPMSPQNLAGRIARMGPHHCINAVHNLLY
jgi:hypothetical protein